MHNKKQLKGLIEQFIEKGYERCQAKGFDCPSRPNLTDTNYYTPFSSVNEFFIAKRKLNGQLKMYKVFYNQVSDYYGHKLKLNDWKITPMDSYYFNKFQYENNENITLANMLKYLNGN